MPAPGADTRFRPGGEEYEDARVIPFGDDHVPSDPGNRPLAEPYFVTVGTIEPRKNHVRLLEAWRSLPDRPRLVVLGRCGGSLRRGRARAAEQGEGEDSSRGGGDHATPCNHRRKGTDRCRLDQGRLAGCDCRKDAY